MSAPANGHVAARTSWVDLASGSRAFLALPGSMVAPIGAVVIGAETDGPLQPALDLATRFAAYGYVAIVPEIASGTEPGQSATSFRDEEVAETMGRAFDYVERLLEVDAGRIVALGIGQSAGYPHLLNSIRPDLAASLVLYGGTRPTNDVIRALTAPTFGIFGESDPAVPVAEVQALRSKLETYRKSYEIHLFPGGSQGWLPADGPNSAPDEVWSEALRFLDALYGGAYPPTRVRWRWLPHGTPNSPH